MKRRSARPFMVEVKQTRSARTSLTSADARRHPDKTLWPELAQAAMAGAGAGPAPAPAPRPERKEPEAPVRRVLPSLVPMFQAPAEADAAPAATTVPETRVRRPRSARVPAAGPDVASRTVSRPRPIAPPAPPVDEAPPVPAAAGQGPSPRGATGRRAAELRPGERWKRRLPHFLR
ncbi:hypothetical protein [Methylobacterium sp. P5_C11]